MKKAKAFIRKWGLWIVFGVALLVLFVRRAVVLRALSGLRTRLAAKQRELEAAEQAAAVAQHDSAIQEHTKKAEELRRQAGALQGEISAIEVEHKTVLEAIDNARNWEELEKLRQEGNAR